MRAFLDETGMAAYVCVPNLVEHRDVPSVAGNDEMGERRSVCYFAQAATTSPRTVAGLAVVPHFSWWEGRSVCCVRSGATWRKTATAGLLAGRGIDADAVVAEALPMAGKGQVSEILLSGLCLTAFAIGMIAGPGDTSAVREQALGTFPSGGLRRFVPRSALAAVSEGLRPMVAAAVLSGARHADARHADAHYVDARHADAHYVDARHADARHADAHYVDARHADAHYVDARHADARHA
jgi:hypothetical protein